MNAVRIFQQPLNGSITVTVPDELRETLCEVIILPASNAAELRYSPEKSTTELSAATTIVEQVLKAFTGTARYPGVVVGEADVYEQ